MKKYRVVLDYGHGGSQPGTTYGELQEKSFNLALGQLIYSELHHQKKDEHDIQVMLTRDADYKVPLRVRRNLINQHHQHIPIDLVCSIHYNSAGRESAHGFECYYMDGSEKGAHFSQHIVKAVKETGTYLRNGGLITTKQLGKNLAMIHRVSPPSVLIEAGYLSNAGDRNKIVDSSYRLLLAKHIASGIWSALNIEGNQS